MFGSQKNTYRSTTHYGAWSMQVYVEWADAKDVFKTEMWNTGKGEGIHHLWISS